MFASSSAAYVGEATRFKSTRESVNVPERNEAVLERAEQHAVQVGMPVTIARATVETILKSSMAFEECIVRFQYKVPGKPTLIYV